MPVVGFRGSEDCLYLNIWRPRNGETGLPVYVFIHGGGNSIGSGTSKDYWGHAMAGKSNLVYVTVNFRLGVMGWFRHPAVTGSGSPSDRSGNFGTLDLIRSLEWLRDNIAAFGGDPGNITIAGESGGAMDVLSLITSPLARGLFHKAVVESGLAITRTKEESETQSARLLSGLLISDGIAPDTAGAQRYITGMSPTDIDRYFRSKSPAELMKNVPTMVGGMADWPAILADGYVLPEEGYGVFTSGNQASRVPLLIGVNKDEMKLFRFLLKDPAPGSPEYELLSEYQSLLWRAGGLDTIAVAITSHPSSPPVYAYRFDWGSPDSAGVSVLPGRMGKVIGASHYAEIPFFLGMQLNQLSLLTGRTYTRANKPGREKLTELCMAYLANFSRTGNPNGMNLPEWKPWNPLPGEHKVIVLDAGLNDLKISSEAGIVSRNSVIQQVQTRLKEPEQSWVQRNLEGKSMFRRAK